MLTFLILVAIMISFTMEITIAVSDGNWTNPIILLGAAFILFVFLALFISLTVSVLARKGNAKALNLKLKVLYALGLDNLIEDIKLEQQNASRQTNLVEEAT